MDAGVPAGIGVVHGEVGVMPTTGSGLVVVHEERRNAKKKPQSVKRKMEFFIAKITPFSL
jgi:hypothetical protein